MAAKKCSDIERVVLVCDGSECRGRGSRQVRKATKKALGRLGLAKSTLLVKTACMGFCDDGPLLMLQPDGTCLLEATARSAAHVVEERLG